MTFSLVPPRSYRSELLDAPGNRHEDLAPALRDIGRVNRWLGGSSAVVRSVDRIAVRRNLREFTLLDVGTGAGDVPRAVMAHASKRGIEVRGVGIDLDPHIVRIASDPDRSHTSSSRLALIRGDGFALPFRDRGIDFVTSSLFLHHFHEAEASRLIAEFARVARVAVVVNDLARHLVPWAVIRILATLFAESPMFRHDAPLSVLKGWTAGELLSVAEGAGLRNEARIRRFAPYRIVLSVEGTAAR